jgi:hypothetical protein
MANISAASYANKNRLDLSTAMWRWNPYFGMYTYLPYRGVACSAFTATCFYSPRMVYRAFYTPSPSPGGYSSGGFSGPSYGYNHDVGAITSSQRSYEGYSNVGSVAGAPAAAVSAPAPPSGDAGGVRGGDSGGGRGGDGGGRSQ